MGIGIGKRAPSDPLQPARHRGAATCAASRRRRRHPESCGIQSWRRHHHSVVQLHRRSGLANDDGGGDLGEEAGAALANAGTGGGAETATGATGEIAVAGAEEEVEDDNVEPLEREKASMLNLSTSLVKSIVGSGVLALPAAVSGLVSADVGATASDSSATVAAAASSSSPSAVLPAAILVILAIGCINGYFFGLIGYAVLPYVLCCLSLLLVVH